MRPRHGNSRRSARVYGSLGSFAIQTVRGAESTDREQPTQRSHSKLGRRRSPSLFTEARVTPAYKVTSHYIFIFRHGAPREPRYHCARGRLNFFLLWRLVAGHMIVSNICML
ncbi:hypothetical protein QQF64_015408 [Cirrhinus molitorella]|uniref:Uncharacterized protein n=1 Tax=Cirrhinus molitorella TaxID=172907 RepID=A0ABR3NVU8_9TELE